MREVISVLLTIFCIAGAQSTCPLPSSTLIRYASEDWQDLKSPNYGVSNYADNTLCQWTIRSQDPSKRIVLVVDSLDLETSGSSGCYDYIQIRDDDYSFGEKYCRPGIPPITSGGQTLYVRFTTDSSSTRSGFHLRYRLVSATESTDSLVPIQTCRSGGMTLQAESYTKYITSLNYPANYPDDTECQWTIQTVTTNYVVKIVVENSDLEYSSSCSWDYLVAYDGSGAWGTQLNKWCGTTRPTIYSYGSALTLKFHSDGSSNRPGFKLSYQEVPESERLSGLSTGAIIGIVVAVLAGFILLSICCCCCCCSKKNKRAATAGPTAAMTSQGVGGTATSAHVTMTTAGSQVFFTTSTFSPNSGQMTTNQYAAAYAPPAYPGPTQCSSPLASAPTMGFSYPQPYAPAGYPAQVPTSMAGNAYYKRQESLPSEPPPPYWMAGQYEVQPPQQPTLDTSGTGGQSQPSSAATASSTATVPAPGADTQQRAQGSAPPAAPRSGQAAPGGSDNRAFVPDEV